jgi:hypothetical protein
MAILAPQTPLNECLAELGGWYTLLEKAVVVAGLRKALSRDDLPPEARAVVKRKAKQVAAAAALAQSSSALSSLGGEGGGTISTGAGAVAAAVAAATSPNMSRLKSSSSSSSLMLGKDNRGMGFDGGGGDGDEDGSGGVVLASSCVEDAFYVAQCAAQRAAAAGHPQSCAAVVNHVNNALASDLFDPLVGRANASAPLLGQGASSEDNGGLAALLGGVGGGQQLLSGGLGLVVGAGDGLLGLGRNASKGVADNASSYLTSAASAARSVASKAGGGGKAAPGPRPVIGQSKSGVGDGGGGDGGVGFGSDDGDVEAALEVVASRGVRHLVNLNNLDACEGCTKKLRDTLLAEVGQGFEAGSPAALQLVSCVNELGATAQRFASAKEEAMGALASHMRPRLRSVVGGLLDEKAGGFVGFNLGDEEYERARNDPDAWAMR